MVIAACPGSGKTTVLKFRAEHLLKSEPGSRLAAVTFTKDAADSLKERIVKQYPQAAKLLDAGTFHSLCMSQLKAAGIKVNLINDGYAARMLREIISQCPHADPSTKYDDYLAAIEQWQRDVNPIVPPAESSALGFVYRKYMERKRANGVMDFGDLLREATIGMQSGKIAPLKVRFMLVDEFQDTDGMQLAWVLEHVKRGVDVTIVGDDDQSIYGFRGSLGYAGMMQFQEATGGQMINLDRTYRCALQVLQPAAVLIANNTARVPKRLITGSTEKGVVRVRPFEDRFAEADAAIEAILESGDPNSWGVLARTNAQLEIFESRIVNRFPFNRKGGSSFWDLKAPSLLLSVVESIAGRNMLGISELLTMGGVSPNAINQITKEFNFEAPGALDRFCKMRLPQSGTNSRDFLSSMQDQVSQWRDMFQSRSQAELKLALGGIAQSILKYGKWKTGDLVETQSRLSNACSSIASLNETIDQRLRTLTQKPEQDLGKGTSLMTLHSSKGLEFDRVWILGCDKDTIPSTRDGTDVQEERRLMYVGITRARADLTLSYSLENGHSQFLTECGLVGTTLFGKTTSDTSAAMV